MLDLLSLTDHDDTANKITADPFGLGGAAHNYHFQWVKPWEDPEAGAIAFRLAESFGFEECSELEDYWEANGVPPDQRERAAFMRLALVDRDLASEIAGLAQPGMDHAQGSIADVVGGLEAALDGPIEAFTVKAIRDALAKLYETEAATKA
jgi:hypothetical protein